MKRFTPLVSGSLGGTLLWLCAATTSAQPLASKELDRKVVEAWKKAGAQVGWYWKDTYGNPWFADLESEPPVLMLKGTDALPAFRLRSVEPGVIVKLPAPSTSFAILLGEAERTDALLKELAGLKSLQGLDLSNTKVTDAGLKELAVLRSLRALHISSTRVTDVGLKQLAALKTLQTLVLRDTPVTDAGLKEIIGLESLQILNLMRTQVTDAGLKELAGFKSLHTLILAGTKVTELKQLADLKSLEYLSLNGTTVGDAGLKELAGLKNLQFLDLFLTKVTDAGVAQLKKELPKLMIQRWSLSKGTVEGFAD